MNYYECYVGSITVKDFISPYVQNSDPIESALTALIEYWPWNEEVPEDFISIVHEYCLNQLAM